MNATDTGFFGTVMTGGAIIAAFCGSFLVFRIQREAEYFRNPGQGYVGQQYFSPSFLLLILATAGATLAGVVLPLLGLSGVRAPFLTPRAVVAGLFGAIVLLGGYFINELVHYRIVFEGWRGDLEGWEREWPLAVVLIFSSVVTLVSCLWLLP